MSEDPGKTADIGTSATDTSNSVQNATTKNTSAAENNMADTSFGMNPKSARVDDANSSGDVMSTGKTLPQENPTVVHSLPIHDEAEASAVKKTKASISGRCDGSELSHFISDEEICLFLKSTLGFDTVEKFASADRFDIARRLFSWYEERTVEDGGGGTGRVGIGCHARPLKVLEAKVFSWRLKMNKIRAHHGLPLLSAGENTAPVENRSVGNAKSVSKGSSTAAADSEEASSNEAESANTRKKRPSTGDKRRNKKIPEELSSAKESTAALNTLSGVDDLLTVLSEEECRFLGNKFWIFTVQQLESVLAQVDTTMKDTEIETSTPLRVAKCHLVDAIMKENAKVAESSSDSSDLASIVPTQERKEDTEIEKRQISTEALTSKWKTNLDARKKPSSDDVIRFFPLDGALSVLMPPALIQFLKAVGIDTAYSLIAARKTENSLLVAVFKIWQEKQGMKPTRAQNIARFLTSVSARVQSAITSIAPADSFTRAWSGSNLIALTSSAREFIVFQCRYSDDESFLEEQTGNIAKKLGNYRAEKGMSVLKGTGNVAVVSSWRTIVKDNSDLEESLRRPLPIVTLDIKAIVASRSNGAGSSRGKANSPASTRGRKQRVSTSAAAQRANTGPGSTRLKPPQGHLSDDISLVMHELQSNDFMHRVLKPSQAKFLQSTGIFNADSLIRADKSEKSTMVQSLIRWRRDRGFDEIPAASASKAIADWSRKVETELNAIKQKRKKDLERENETIVLKNDSTGKRSGDSGQSRQIKKKKRVVPKKFLEHSGLDPIEALSPSAREFLSTLGVTTAEEFLSETTSDLGTAFISWRARTGLDELKGAGAISIVSGWKGQVRDVCEYLGKQSLIDLDAAVRKKSLSGNGGVASSSGGTSSSSSKEGLSQLPYNAPSRSSEALIEDELLGPNVLDKPEDRFVSKSGILNGLSSRNFTVRGNGKDTTFYDFQLSIRSRDGAVNESSNKREGDDVAQQDNFAVCLTYRGARINRSSVYFNEDTDSKAGDLLSRSHSPSAPPITIPILSHCSLSDHQGDTTIGSGGESFEKSHIPFCSFAATSPAKYEGGGLVDLTRFHIFPGSQSKISECNDYTNGILEAFVEGRGGVRGGDNAVSEDNSDGDSKMDVNANVSIVLDPATGEKQYLLCLANPIEKGQTLVLVPSNTSTIAPASLNTKIHLDDPSDYPSRHGVFSLIESMTAIQLLNTLEVLEKKQEVVTEQMRRIMPEHTSTSENQSQEASAMSIGEKSGDTKKSDKNLLPISVLISRRRIHFVASTILRQVKALLKEDRLSQLDRSTLTSTNGRIDKLLWDKVCVEAIGSTAEGAGERSKVLYEQLEEEITNELQFSLARQQAVVPRCPLSSQLDGMNSKLIARYALTTAGSNSGQNQQILMKEMYLAAQKSAKDLHLCSEAKSQDDILRLILPCKSAIDSHRHISHLPRGLPIHLASSLPTLSYTSIGETSFQYPPSDDTTRKGSEDSFIVLKADSGFSFTSMVLLLNERSESDRSLLMGALTSSTRRLDLSVDSSWYLQNQIIAPTDEMAQSGLVSWCRPIHALCAPSYSLKDLTEAVFQSLGDVNIAQPDDSVDSAFGSNRDLALHLPSSDGAAFARATRADYYPKTLPIFLRILFPHLEQKFSWKVHCGRSPDSLTYLPPETLDKRRKDASFDFTASEKRRKKTLLKMRRANAPKLPRKLRQIFITFAKAVAKMEDTAGQANVEQKANDDNDDSANDAATNEPQVPAADADSSKMAAAAGKPAKDVVESFVESIDFKGDESKGAVMTAMAQSILTMFDKTIPSSFPSGPSNARDPTENISDDQSTSTRSGTKSPCESYCAEYLLWWMILLPDLLVKAGLPLRQQQLIEGFVEAMFLYFSENHSEIFTMFDYSDSIAIDEETAESIDISQFVLGVIEKASEESKNDEDSNRSASTDKPDGNDQNDQHNNADEEFSTTVLRDHERHLLTDFVCHALDQVQLCFLREEDLSSGKRGTFRVGYPGMVCKHCKEAKMFYSNVSSLSACAPGIHIHCQRCKRCPKEIVDEMNEKKKLHNPQKKTLKMGSMAKFYHSLYKRMMRMRRATDGGAFLDESSSDESSGEDDTESDNQTGAEDDAQDGSNGDDVYFDHIDAIASIAEDKFYQRRNMNSAIDLYYQCVERGGLVWKTDALPRSLPDEMMSEWLLKLILRRLNRGLPLISAAPIEKETSPNVSTHSASTSVYRSTSAPNNNSNYTACSIEGCSKHRQSKCDGMCRAHWSLMQKTGARPGAVNSTKNHATKRKSTSPGVGIEMQKGSNNSWSCHQCGEDNDPESQRCSGCKGWRGGKRRFTQNSTSSGTTEAKLLEKIPWTCHLCGKENPGTKQRCTHPCRAWRGGKRLHL